MDMKKIGRQMSLLMGVSLSFCLSLVGNLVGAARGGKFSIAGWLISFVVSTVISLIIGAFVPMKKLGDSFVAKCGAEPNTTKARLLESLLSDIIYTPIMTIIMVAMAHHQAASHGQAAPYIIMLIPSLVVTLIVGYVLIYFLMPFFLKMLMKKNGMGGRPPEDRQ